jgi:hypothetical protein
MPSRSGISLALVFAAATALPGNVCSDELQVPGFTAYSLPDPDSIRFSEHHGATRWNDPSQSINWFGLFRETGDLMVRIDVQPVAGQSCQLRLTVDGTSRDATVTAPEAKDGAVDSESSGPAQRSVTVDFGTFSISAPGYHCLRLELLPGTTRTGPNVVTLRLDGPAITNAHFNLKERRNAASVHLSYPVPDRQQVAAFYCEATAIADPVHTFYMACGWHRGYFGMQVNSPTERRIIFSVWDSGNEAIDRSKVADHDRVQLVAKGEGVYSGDFGHEGTGGHSHLKYDWNSADTQRFLITAEPVDGNATIYSGFWFHPELNAWQLISAWRAPHDGSCLRGLHSFSENFVGANGHLVRHARFGQQRWRSPDGEWHELTSARFSHDATGAADRLDRCMGVEESQFFLRHGGFVEGFTESGRTFQRPPTRELPVELTLPLPAVHKPE